MNLILVDRSNTDDVEKLRSIYFPYISELNSIEPKLGIVTEQEKEASFNSYISSPCNLYFISECTANNIIIGLVFLQKINVPFCYEVATYIAEFYVLPEFRRKGAGTEAVGLIASASKKAHSEYSPIFLHILEKNTVAKNFWENSMKKSGLKLISKTEESEIISLYSFKFSPLSAVC